MAHFIKSRLTTGGQLARQFRLLAKAFGPMKAAKVLAQLHGRRRTNDGLLRITLPDLRAPIFLRPETSDIAVLFQTFVKPQYDAGSLGHLRVVQQRYASLVDRGVRPVIVDCGANIGLSALWFAKQFPMANIQTVEPLQANIGIMNKNVSAYPNIHVRHGAVWDRNVPLAIVDNKAEAWAIQTQELPAEPVRAGEEQLSTFTIDGILSDCGADAPFIVKIDIEGGEQSLFRSSTDWIRRTDLIIIELHDYLFPWQGLSQNFFRALADLPFDYVFKGENLFCFRHQERGE